MSLPAIEAVDPILKHALKLLHSSKPDSASEMRKNIEEMILSKYGSKKMLQNTISKKYINEEKISRGSGYKNRKEQKSECKSAEKSKSKTSCSSTPSLSAATMEIVSEIQPVLDDFDEEGFKELEDLTCVICRRMESNTINRLIECSECQSLYHNLCHKPIVEASEIPENFICSACKSKFPISKPTGSPLQIKSPKKNYDSSSSESRNSESFQKKIERPPKKSKK